MRALSASVKMSVVLILALGLSVGGCSKKSKQKPSKGTKAGMAALKVAKKKPPKAKKTPSKPPLSPPKRAKLKTPEYKQLVLALATCEIKKHTLDYDCAAYKTLQKTRRGKTLDIKDFSRWSDKWALELLKHKAAAVRWQAVSMLGSGMKRLHVTAVIMAAGAEKNIGVLRHMIDTIDKHQKKNPQVGAFIVKSLAHENEDVRLRAVWSLAEWGKTTANAGKALVKLVHKDKSLKVRQAACQGLGKLENDAWLKPLRKVALSKRTPADLCYYCFKGIIQMWTRFPLHPANPSRKAYELTLKLLKQKKRSDKRPPWGIAGMFTNLYKENDKAYKSWAAKAPWYKKKDLLTAMGAVIRDPRAGSMARSALVETAAKLGAPKAFFKKLLKAYKGKEKKPRHSAVVRALKKRL